MAAENEIFVKITSESDLDARQKEIERLTKEAEDFEKELSQLATRREQDAESIKKQVLQSDALKKKLAENKQYYRQEAKRLKDAIKERKQSIKALSDEVKAYKTLHGQSGKAVQQLRAMREELMRMEDAGQFGTQAFVDLSIAAAQLEDQIGDTQQRIRVLASDTKEIDAVMGLGDGLAGTFYIATSAAEVLGDDIEGLQKAFYKVQAAMSVVSGVQQVWNALNKDSAAMVVINNALTKLFAKNKRQAAAATAADAASSGADAAAKGLEAGATTAAAAAQKSLNAAFLANPVGVVLAGVIALVAAGYAIVKMLSKTERAARAAKKAQELYDKQNVLSTYNLNIYAKEHDKALYKIEQEEVKRMQEAKKRHASNLEMSRIELETLKKNAEEQLTYSNKAIKENNIAQVKANEVYQKRLDQVSKTKKGTDEYYKAMELLSDAERQMNDVWQRGNDIIKERDAAQNAVKDKEQEISDMERELVIQRSQINIDLMREGSKKEIAQINANYDEQLRAITGNSDKEIALRAALVKKRDQEIADVERMSAIELQKTMTEIDVQTMEERTKALRGDEGVDAQLKVWNDYYVAREDQMRENARLEIDEVRRSTDSEEVKREKVTQINLRLDSDLTAIKQEGAQKRAEIEAQYLTDLEIAADKTARAVERANSGGTTSEKMQALKANLDAELALYDEQEKQLKKQWETGALTDYQEYQRQMWEILKNSEDARYNYQVERMNAIKDEAEKVLNAMQQVSDLAFEAIGQNIQAQMDALDESYTTDYEEAQKNTNKKYMTEQEYAKKKAALEQKQAKYQKAQALINAGINTALAIMQAIAQFGPPPSPMGIAGIAMAAAMGAAQIAVIASKPLAQYAKGRKGGKGEYALVGEKGPELMYVPRGASIVPNNKMANQAAWGDYGVPRLNIPELPSVSEDATRFVATASDGRLTIDYDKLGEAVARNIPRQQPVTINVDRNGVHVLDGANTRTYLNRKYTGSW